MKQIDILTDMENETEPTEQELKEIAETEETDWSKDAWETIVEEMAAKESGHAVDGFRNYLREIGRYPLLSREEEQKQGAICKAWQTEKKPLDEAEKQLKQAEKRLTNGNARGDKSLKWMAEAQTAVTDAQKRVNEERRRWSEASRSDLWRKGEEARNKLVNHNLRLVVSLAKKYRNSPHTMEELVGWGNQGLVKGIERFDPEKGCKVSTYASFWIKKEIQKGLAEAQGLSVGDWELFVKIKRISNAAEMAGEEDLQSEEIALRIKREKSAKQFEKRNNRTARPEELPTDEEIRSDRDFPRLVKNIERLRNWRHADSLSSPVGEDGDATWEDFLPNQSPDPLEEILESEPWKRLKTVFNERDIPVAEVFQTVFFLRRTETDKNGNVLPSRKFMEKYGKSLRTRYGEPYRRAYGRELLQSSKDVDEMIKQVYTILFTPENLNILKTLDPR